MIANDEVLVQVIKLVATAVADTAIGVMFIALYVTIFVDNGAYVIRPDVVVNANCVPPIAIGDADTVNVVALGML